MDLKSTLLSAALSLAPAAAAAQTVPARPSPEEAGTPHAMTPPAPGANQDPTFPSASTFIELSSAVVGTGGAGVSFDSGSPSLPSGAEVVFMGCVARTHPSNYTLFGNVNGRGWRVCGIYANNFTGNQRMGVAYQVRLMSLLDEAVAVDAGIQVSGRFQDYAPTGGQIGVLVTAGVSVGRLFKASALNWLYGDLHIPINFNYDYTGANTFSLTFGLGLGLSARF